MPETADTFLADLRGRIDYFRKEFDLSYSEAIGCLEIVKHELAREATEEDIDWDIEEEEERENEGDLDKGAW